jgi:hypothetical protein
MKEEVVTGDERIRPLPHAKRGRVLSAICQIAGLVRAILREIFDESAYQRFLDRTQLASSVHAYARFRQESEEARSRRHRCC